MEVVAEKRLFKQVSKLKKNYLPKIFKKIFAPNYKLYIYLYHS